MPFFQRHSTPSSSVFTSPLDTTPRVYSTTANIAFVGGAAAAVLSQPRPSGTGGGIVNKIDIATSILAVGGIVRMISTDSRPFGVRTIVDITRRPPVPALRRQEEPSETEDAEEKGGVVFANHVTRRGRIYRVTSDLPGMGSSPEVFDTQGEVSSSGAGQPENEPIVQDGSDDTPPPNSSGSDAQVDAASITPIAAAEFKLEVAAPPPSPPPPPPPPPPTPEVEDNNGSSIPFYFDDLLLFLLALLVLVIGGRFVRHRAGARQQKRHLTSRSRRRRNTERNRNKPRQSMSDICPARTLPLGRLEHPTSSPASSENTCPVPIFELTLEENPIVFFADSAFEGAKELFHRPREEAIDHVERSLYVRVRVAAYAQFYIISYTLARSLLSFILPYLKATVLFIEEVLLALDNVGANEEEVKGNTEPTEQPKKTEKEKSLAIATEEIPTLVVKTVERSIETENKKIVYQSVFIQTEEIEKTEPASRKLENVPTEAEIEENWEMEVVILFEKPLSESDACASTKEDENKEPTITPVKENLEDEWMTAVPAEASLVQNDDDALDDALDIVSNASFDIPVESSLCERIMDEPSPARLDHEDEFDFWFDTIPSPRPESENRTPSPCAIPVPLSTHPGYRRRRLRRRAKAKRDSQEAEAQGGEVLGADFLLGRLQSKIDPAVTPLPSRVRGRSSYEPVGTIT